MRTILGVALVVWVGCGGFGTLRAQLPADARRPLGIADSTLSLTLLKITLAAGTLQPRGELYEGTYQVRVSPLPFGSEEGRISMRVTEADLRRLGRGETVTFRGEATNGDGKPRQVSARATPGGPDAGQVRLRIMADGRKVVFQTTYRFEGP